MRQHQLRALIEDYGAATPIFDILPMFAKARTPDVAEQLAGFVFLRLIFTGKQETSL
jgi:hypothetical protein